MRINVKNLFEVPVVAAHDAVSCFLLHHYIIHHAQADLLSHDELEMVLFGAMMTLTRTDNHTHDGCHKTAERK